MFCIVCDKEIKDKSSLICGIVICDNCFNKMTYDEVEALLELCMGVINTNQRFKS